MGFLRETTEDWVHHSRPFFVTPDEEVCIGTPGELHEHLYRRLGYGYKRDYLSGYYVAPVKCLIWYGMPSSYAINLVVHSMQNHGFPVVNPHMSFGHMYDEMAKILDPIEAEKKREHDLLMYKSSLYDANGMRNEELG